MKFRRKSTSAESAPTEHVDVPDQVDAQPPVRAAVGPYDVDDLPDDGRPRVDLGSLLVPSLENRELRLQVDERSGTVAAVLLTGPDGALEVRAFAAPRNGDLWSEVRPQIAADMTRRGGVAAEREGRFGTELICQMPARQPDGSTAVQPSRIVGINGPRWLLRATLIGKPALDPEISDEWAGAITSLAVRRGEGAMPVGEPLPVVLPENASRMTRPAG